MRAGWLSLGGVGACALVTGCGAGGEAATAPASAATAAPTPCSSPYAVGDLAVAVPSENRAVSINARVGDYLVVGFAHCGEAGTIGVQSGDAILRGSDDARAGKGGPTIDVRWRMVSAGTAEIRGVGDRGSHGTIVVHVK